MSGAKCLRCGAGSEWIKGKVPNERAESELAASSGSALAMIESMRQKGYVVQLDNGLDGTWEVQFYQPDEMLRKNYGAGDTIDQAVRDAIQAHALRE